jgi:hypothetical protein
MVAILFFSYDCDFVVSWKYVRVLETWLRILIARWFVRLFTVGFLNILHLCVVCLNNNGIMLGAVKMSRLL